MIPDGYVAVTSTARRTLLHLAAPPFGERTLCGRYDRDRYLPEDAEVADDTAKCGACLQTAEHDKARATAAGFNTTAWPTP